MSDPERLTKIKQSNFSNEFIFLQKSIWVKLYVYKAEVPWDIREEQNNDDTRENQHNH